MDFFRRIGTQKHKFKVQFFLGKMKFSKHIDGQIYVAIKRGDHKVKSQAKHEMDQNNKCNFNKQIMSFQALTLFYDEESKLYQQKTGELRVILINKDGDKKLLGVVNFDLAEYANAHKQSIKQKKKLQQSPKSMQGLIEYQVYIKYIGEASQTNKSVNTNAEKKKQSSSLDKFTNFFFGSHENQDQNQKQKQDKKNKKVSPPKPKDNKDANKKNPTQNNNEKPKGKEINNNSEEDEQAEQFQEANNKKPVKNNKNYVVSKKFRGGGTAQFASEKQDSLKDSSTKKFYFDQPNFTEPQKETNNLNLIKKASKRDPSQQEEQPNAKNKKQKPKDSGKQLPVKNKQSTEDNNKNKKSNTKQNLQQRQKKTTKQQTKKSQSKNKSDSQEEDEKGGQNDRAQQILKYFKPKSKGTNQNTQKPEESTDNRRQKNIQKQKQPNGRIKGGQQQNVKILQKECTELRDKYQKVLKQKSIVQGQNKAFQKQISRLNQELSQLKDQFQRTKDHKQRQTISKISITQQQFTKALSIAQKKNNQYLVQITKLKQKYKSDFKRYQQMLEEKSNEREEVNELSKAQLKRMKQECSSYREKIEKIEKQKDQSKSQSKKQKAMNQKLAQQIADCRTSLSKIKMKIGSRLNEALQNGDDNIIDLLTDLNKQ